MITSYWKLETIIYGNRLDWNEESHVITTANVWFVARFKNEKAFVVISCIATPDFEDYELGIEKDLIKRFSNIKNDIEKLNL